jgi:hypothetical protein
MGYYVTYNLKLRIPAKDVQRALDIFNHLHTDEMLKKYARGGSYPQTDKIQECYWYSWVTNPRQPYASLTEAFSNWCIVEENAEYATDPETQDFIVSGNYDNKWGQQDFLIEQLAPVLNDTVIHVTGEDRAQYHWVVENHTYRTWREDAAEDEDDEEEGWDEDDEEDEEDEDDEDANEDEEDANDDEEDEEDEDEEKEDDKKDKETAVVYDYVI